MKIIYPSGSSISVIHPTGELSIEEVARKDVPAGVAYLIVDDSVIPSDRTFRDAWEADFSVPDGYGIGAEAWFAEQPTSIADRTPQQTLDANVVQQAALSALQESA